ncbi:MAG: chaperonin GroEL, partial [Calditrichaeota bacterium]|nr:chaperonin GroEL [Calditrichota bacterium]
GVDIVRRSLEEPMRQIVANCGLEGSVIVHKVKEGKDAFGFNAATEKFEDLLEAGVIDPTKVTRSALENAASVTGLLLMTEALITDLPEDDKPAAPAMPPGGMGGMY